jgi:8-oxo-dGTP diphosphatase
MVIKPFKVMILVTAAIIFNKSKILIARRANNKHLAGFWEFPGGKVEEGESAEECLKREIGEELGINVKVGAFFMENHHHYGEKHILLKAYFCDLISGNIVLNDHDQIEWVEKANLHKYDFAPADIPFVESLIDGK